MDEITRTRRALGFSLAIICSILFALITMPVSAQDWRGTGHISGSVKDESGQPLADVTVKMALAGRGGTQTKTNQKGEWSIGGLAAATNWTVDLQKPGFDPRHLTGIEIASSGGVGRTVPMNDLVLKHATAATDPNIEIRDQLVKAAGLMNQKKFTEAREIYETLYQKYPQATQILPLVARAYYGEGQYDKAIENLRAALEKDPNSNEVKLLLGNVLLAKGSADEGRQILSTVDESKITSPDVWLNVGIALLNQNKPAEAIAYFTKAIEKFPQTGDSYYYRALAELQQGQNPAAKADLEKYIQIAPDTPEASNAKKILEQLK